MTAPTGKYRHEPNEPAALMAVLTEGTDRHGKKYFFSFDQSSGRKLFMVQDRVESEKWRLYSQPLAPQGMPADLPRPPERGPHGGRIITGEPPLMVSGFVSGLAPRRKWGAAR